LPQLAAVIDCTLVRTKAAIAGDVADIHAKNIEKTGYAPAGALNINTQTPPIVESAKRNVQEQLEPQNKESIPARAAALDENVHAWASPDKQMGEGRANPMAVVEDMMVRDLLDYGRKAWSKVTGGSGTADGEIFNDNQRRENAAEVQINSGVKKN
jgi:conjugal transfer mating pair stabilization protein TraG